MEWRFCFSKNFGHYGKSQDLSDSASGRTLGNISLQQPGGQAVVHVGFGFYVNILLGEHITFHQPMCTDWMIPANFTILTLTIVYRIAFPNYRYL